MDAAVDAAPPADAGFVVLTFNTGTNPGLPHARSDDGYGAAEAELSDRWYGDGLAWRAVIDDTRAFLTAVDPDVVAFQEVFWAGECPEIPSAAHPGFVCADWTPDAPGVPERLLGPEFQIACHRGKPDKCAAVHRRFGTFRGCDAPVCLDLLDAADVAGCGRGARVAAGVIERVDGQTLTLVSVHGTSGLTPDDQACRLRQVERIFVDGGDGRPLADGERNLVLGDLNTDPGRWAAVDTSAARWLDFVGPERPFRFLTAVGRDTLPTYAAVASIDHVVADRLEGECRAAGLADDLPAPTATVFFDHRPIVCMVRASGSAASR